MTNVAVIVELSGSHPAETRGPGCEGCSQRDFAAGWAVAGGAGESMPATIFSP
jgi:hypothetical protein